MASFSSENFYYKMWQNLKPKIILDFSLTDKIRMLTTIALKKDIGTQRYQWAYSWFYFLRAWYASI